MSNQSDSQNMSEEQVQMSEGTSPSSSSDDGSRSTPSNLGATELWLDLTEFTSLGAKTASVSPSLKIGRSEMISMGN